MIEFAVTDTGIGIAAGTPAGIVFGFRADRYPHSKAASRHGSRIVARQEIRGAPGRKRRGRERSGQGVALLRADSEPILGGWCAVMIDAREITKKSGPIRILVVDDNPAALYATARVLRSAGYEVLEATTGAAGLEAAPFADLVVLDINLPDMDGFEVCRRMRASPRTAGLPVLHLSATFTQSADYAQGFEAGADSYLTRPVEAPVLIATVRTLLFARHADLVGRRVDARLRAMFELAPVAIAVLDDGLTLESVNPAFCALTGYAPSELIGRQLAACLSDSPGNERELAIMEAAIHERFSGHFIFRHKNGSLAEIQGQVARESVIGRPHPGGRGCERAAPVGARPRKPAEQRARGSRRRGAQQPAQGGVPRHPVARAAQPAERHSRMGDALEPQARAAGGGHSGPQGDRAQFPHSGADDLGPSGLCRYHLRQSAAGDRDRRSVPRRQGHDRERERCGAGRRGRAAVVLRRGESFASRRTPHACSRSSGTC